MTNRSLFTYPVSGASMTLPGAEHLFKRGPTLTLFKIIIEDKDSWCTETGYKGGINTPLATYFL
jgi:hypothetical protein